MTPAPPKPRRGRPPTPASPVPALDDGLEARLRASMDRTHTVAQRLLDKLEAIEDPTIEQAEGALRVGNLCGVMLGSARRHTESVRNAGKKLSLPIVLSWVREQSPDVKAQVAEECGEAGAERNVLGDG